MTTLLILAKIAITEAVWPPYVHGMRLARFENFGHEDGKVSTTYCDRRIHFHMRDDHARDGAKQEGATLERSWRWALLRPLQHYREVLHAV
jgi:hypothetical protein